jgi:hypothetical protein
MDKVQPSVVQAEVALILDAGALLAVDRRNRMVGAVLEEARRDQLTISTSAAALAQVWRNGARQANLLPVLRGIAIASLDRLAAQRVGELLGTSRTRDVVDAHVALLVDPGDTILTSEAADLTRLLHTRQVRASVVQV